MQNFELRWEAFGVSLVYGTTEHSILIQYSIVWYSIVYTPLFKEHSHILFCKPWKVRSQLATLITIPPANSSNPSKKKPTSHLHRSPAGRIFPADSAARPAANLIAIEGMGSSRSSAVEAQLNRPNSKFRNSQAPKRNLDCLEALVPASRSSSICDDPGHMDSFLAATQSRRVHAHTGCCTCQSWKFSHPATTLAICQLSSDINNGKLSIHILASAGSCRADPVQYSVFVAIKIRFATSQLLLPGCDKVRMQR